MHCFLASTGSVNSRCLGQHNEAVMALLQPAEKEGTLHVLPAVGFPESKLFSAAHPQGPGRSIDTDDRGATPTLTNPTDFGVAGRFPPNQRGSSGCEAWDGEVSSLGSSSSNLSLWAGL